MGFCKYCQREHNIGFISTRLAGSDGVSLKTEKWARFFEKEGLSCFYFAGEVDPDPNCSQNLPKAHFKHPQVLEIHKSSFGVSTRQRALTQQIQAIKHKDDIYRFTACPSPSISPWASLLPKSYRKQV